MPGFGESLLTFTLFHRDCLEWLPGQASDTYHAVVTDPPFGLEYESDALSKLRERQGGVWRVPPKGRSPLPRFTVLKNSELEKIQSFFSVLAEQLSRVLRPGGHVLIASNTVLTPWVFGPFLNHFERRGEIIRLVKTLRGGDRPKGAEKEFPHVSVTPRGSYEPWGIFRKPLSEKTVSQNLRKWGTGGLRRVDSATPFTDVIESGLPSQEERRISSHPTMKPQKLVRSLVRAALPEGGLVLDPFAGSGSTLAAAEFLGFDSHGVERDALFYQEAQRSVPRLAEISDWSAEQEMMAEIFESEHT